MRFVLLSALLLAPSLAQVSPVLAQDDKKICDQAALAAAEAQGVPTNVMLAIARVETGHEKFGSYGPWPWTVHYAGAGHWFDTKSEAVAFAQSVIDHGASNIDLGCFQLNLRWHGKNFSSLEQMFDPIENANHAARFLSDNHARKGNWVDAVAAYHSSKIEHAKLYIAKVTRVLSELGESEILPDPTFQMQKDEVAIKENRFALLQSGEVGAIGSLVPRVTGVAPFFGGLH